VSNTTRIAGIVIAGWIQEKQIPHGRAVLTVFRLDSPPQAFVTCKLCAFHCAVLDSNITPVPILSYVIIAVAGYLLGSIPTGYLVARAKGIDIRTVGSGNIGATNAFRVLGKPAGIFVLVVDGLKGYAACALLAPYIFDWLAPDFFVEPVHLKFRFAIIAGIAAVLGHNYTCWLHFKGGKGIATSAGVYFALAPLAVTLALAAWIVVFLLTRYVSVASLASAIALPTAVWFRSDSLLLGIVTTALGLLAIAKHKANIQRLFKGTESKISFRRKGAAT
jgi:acyl phosphate:glycerol-3-phosphate acyltransferase